MDMLRIDGLYKSFGSKAVLKGMSMCVPEHSVFGFIGKNGSGKTTTMKTVLGFMKPDAGEVYVAGEKVVFGQTATNKYIGYLPDVPEFYSFMTAREYLTFCGEISDMPKADIDARCDELLKLVGLYEEKGNIKGFSRGMKQRLGIAQALFSRPKLLICDEPTSALDPVGRKEILDILLSIKNETTVLFSTHVLSDVEKICTDIAFLDDGVITVHGKLDEIRANFRGEEYIIETEKAEDAMSLLNAFESSMQISPTKIVVDGKKCDVNEVISFIANNKISLLKLERYEKTLESLFMEVVNK